MTVKEYVITLPVMKTMQIGMGLRTTAHNCLSPQQVYVMTHEGHIWHSRWRSGCTWLPVPDCSEAALQGIAAAGSLQSSFIPA